MAGFLLAGAPIDSLAAWLATEVGGAGIAAARSLGRDATISAIGAAGLRGRGGAGFPTARKWSSVVGATSGTRYLVCNGAEGEPGTFKDRALIRHNPYQLVEGLVIAAHTVGAAEAFICLKARFADGVDAVTRAVEEFQSAGVCGDCTVNVVAGPDEYLYGEEKAMLEVIEGKPPLPRQLPPYEQGLYAASPQLGWEAGPHAGPAGAGGANPTVVNNVETLCNLPHLLANGPDWFRSMGTDASPGTVVATVVGDVARPGVAEVELGTPLAEVIEIAGGGPGAGRTVKAVFPGVSNAVVTADHLDVRLTYEDFAAIGSGMGAAGFIVCDDTACMVDAAYRLSRFLAVESCGQCPPCKLGSGEITAALERIETGAGTDDDLSTMQSWLGRVTDGARCYLAVEEQQLVASVLRAFPEEFADHIEHHRCPRPVRRPIPKLVDLRDDTATYDDRYWYKRADWTYDDPPG